jgi:peroxiredoxin Q/BCP
MAAKKKTTTGAGGKPGPGAPAPDGRVGEGDRAPTFSAPDHEGKPFGTGDLAGRPWVLYFYPKADTPGCTTESCGFRDRAAAFAEAGVTLLGASPDGPRAQARFRERHDLPFRLLCDETHAVAEAWGVWAKKSMYGREYMGIERSTFLVGADGRIVRAWRGVKVPGHVEEVLAAAKGLAAR